MPRSIEQGFKKFHDKLKATTTESAAAKYHRASIEACLKSNFKLSRFTRMHPAQKKTNQFQKQ
ncbi:hypothetical protein VU10_07900, partial [Desulfobulbus sp. US1]|nr:hypothetical protein [Desulfobulbus sp. US1]